MSISTHVAPAGPAEGLKGADFSVSRHAKAAAAWVSAWAAARADSLAAATVYEELSRLSDAELGRRGLSRDTLSRNIGETFGNR
jgi:hypothetical protein